MRIILPFLLTFYLSITIINGQNFQFAQYDFTHQRINPALVAVDNFSEATFAHRNQSTSGDFPITSTFFSLDYPLNHGKKGKRWAGVGIYVLNDKAGKGSALRLDQLGISYGFNFHLPKNQSVNLGISATLNTRRFTYNEFLTESQFVNGFGFDGGLFNGENLGDIKKNYLSVNTGIYWEIHEKKGQNIAYAGLTLGDLNRPNTAFFSQDAQVHSAITFIGGGKVYEQDNFSIIPELLLFYNGAGLKFNVGPTIHFPLDGYSIGPLTNNLYFDLGVKYYTGNNLIGSVEFGTADWAIGLGYETGNENRLANQGTFEIALRYKKEIKSKKTIKRKRVKRKKKKRNRIKKTRKRKSKKKKYSSNRRRTRTFDRSKSIPSKKGVIEKTNKKTPQESQRAEEPQQKPPSENKIENETVSPVSAEPTEETPPLITISYEKDWVVQFEFNEEVINGESRLILDRIIDILLEYPELKIVLSGHTDSYGTQEYNMKLSIRRAESVKGFLIKKEISPKRMMIEGKGEGYPISDNKSLKGRLQNRRVEIQIFE